MFQYEYKGGYSHLLKKKKDKDSDAEDDSENKKSDKDVKTCDTPVKARDGCEDIRLIKLMSYFFCV